MQTPSPTNRCMPGKCRVCCVTVGSTLLSTRSSPPTSSSRIVHFVSTAIIVDAGPWISALHATPGPPPPTQNHKPQTIPSSHPFSPFSHVAQPSKVLEFANLHPRFQSLVTFPPLSPPGNNIDRPVPGRFSTHTRCNLPGNFLPRVQDFCWLKWYRPLLVD